MRKNSNYLPYGKNVRIAGTESTGRIDFKCCQLKADQRNNRTSWGAQSFAKIVSLNANEKTSTDNKL